MDWQPLARPACSRAEADFINQLLSETGGNIKVTIADQVYDVHLAACTHGYRTAVVLRCRAGDATLSVYLGDSALDALLASVIPLSSFSTLPEDLQLALLSAAFFPFAETLEKQTGTALAVERSELSPEVVNAGVLLEISPAQAAATHSVLVSMQGHSLPTSVIEWLQSSGQAPVAREYEWLGLPVELEAGSALLGMSEVEALQFGDIMLLRVNYLSEGQLRVNINGCFSCVARIDGSDLIVLTPLEKIMAEESTPPEDADGAAKPESPDGNGGPASSEENTEQASSPAPSSGAGGRDTQPSLNAADLPMKILFVAGRLSVPLGELQKIQPGYVFDLNKDASREIEIRVNGAEIGSGELVEVDGRTGVRILECK